MTQAAAGEFWGGSVGYISVASWAVGPVFEIQTGPTDYAILSDLLILVLGAAGAAQTTIGFGNSASPGVMSGQIPLVISDGFSTNDPPGIVIGSSWTSAPALPSNFIRRSTINVASQQTHIRWRFSIGLKMAPSSSWSIWILSGNAGIDFALAVDAEFDI